MTIKELREQAGLSRAEMSRQFEIPLRTLENWESGKSCPPPYVEKWLMAHLYKMKEEQTMKKDLVELTTEETYAKLVEHLKKEVRTFTKMETLGALEDIGVVLNMDSFKAVERLYNEGLINE